MKKLPLIGLVVGAVAMLFMKKRKSGNAADEPEAPSSETPAP